MGVGFEDEQGFLPVLCAARKEDEPQATGSRKGGLFYLAVKDDELLAEQSVFGDEVEPTMREVGGGAEHNRMIGRLGEMEEGCFEASDQTDGMTGWVS